MVNCIINMKDWKDILWEKIKDDDNYNTFAEM